MNREVSSNGKSCHDSKSHSHEEDDKQVIVGINDLCFVYGHLDVARRRFGERPIRRRSGTTVAVV